mgnify:CR=1 FL=1
MRKGIGVMAAVLLFMPATTAEARVIGKASARGGYAVAVAAGSATKPKWVKVTVSTSPRQRAAGNWLIVCAKGFGAGTKQGGFRGTGTFTRALRLPTRNPDECTASATAQLERGGKITVILTAG